MKNSRIVFAKRPFGEPDDECFRLEEVDVPPLSDNQLLIKVGWLSLDPYMRGRMNDVKSYVEPMQLGDVMTGESAGVVVESSSERFSPGDHVAVHQGWQSYIVCDDDDPRLMKIDLSNGSLSAHLGVVGMPGRTAYFGLKEVGKPQEGETLVVAAASGAVGSAVYPGAGSSETLLVILGIVLWLGWHVLTAKSESEELSRLARKRHGANDHKSNVTDW